MGSILSPMRETTSFMFHSTVGGSVNLLYLLLSSLINSHENLIPLFWHIMMTSSNGNIFRVTAPLWGNPPVTDGFPSQRPVTQRYHGFFYGKAFHLITSSYHQKLHFARWVSNFRHWPCDVRENLGNRNPMVVSLSMIVFSQRWGPMNVIWVFSSETTVFYNYNVLPISRGQFSPKKSQNLSIPFELWCLDALVLRYMMTSWNGNIFRVTGPLWGEFTGSRWISHTKARDASE